MALMRRQSLVKFDAPLCETIVDTPKPQGKEVLVRIERYGLCHSDLHIQDGYADLGGGRKLDTTRGMTLPFTLGHEIAGIVEEVGPDVSRNLIGTKKAVFPWIGCGQCRDCLAGDENLCAKYVFSASPSTAVSPATCWCPTQGTCWITAHCRSIRPRP
jgi:alcohol dehydrogenase